MEEQFADCTSMEELLRAIIEDVYELQVKTAKAA